MLGQSSLWYCRHARCEDRAMGFVVGVTRGVALRKVLHSRGRGKGGSVTKSTAKINTNSDYFFSTPKIHNF